MKKTFSALWLCGLCSLLTVFGYAQQLVSIIPNSGSIGQTLDVVVLGNNTAFKSGNLSAQFGAGIMVTKITVQNDYTCIVSLQIAANATEGNRHVSLTANGSTTTLNNGFEVFKPGGLVRAILETVPVETISVGDVDVSSGTSKPSFFYLHLFNDAVRRKVTVEVTISSAKAGLIGKAFTNTIDLEANAVKRLSGKEFPRFDITKVGIEFQKMALATGAFPPDNYTYKAVVKDAAGTIVADDINETVLTNKTYHPELIAPGAVFTQPIPEVLTPFPQFQWFSQSDKFEFSLYKVLPRQTPEEAIRNIPVYKQSGITGNSLVYPNYAEQLVDSQEYAWQIKSAVQTTSGGNPLPSEVFKFRYRDAAKMSISACAVIGAVGSLPPPPPPPPPPLDNKIGSLPVSSGNTLLGVAKITMLPKEIEVFTGGQVQLAALAEDVQGKPVGSSRVVWTVSNPAKAFISAGGLLTAGNQAGVVAAIAKMGNITEYATIVIKPQPPQPANKYNLDDLLIDKMVKKMFGLP